MFLAIFTEQVWKVLSFTSFDPKIQGITTPLFDGDQGPGFHGFTVLAGLLRQVV